VKSKIEISAAVAMALRSSLAQAQSGHMMNGGGWYGGWMGGYGAMWIPILLIVIVGLLAWIVIQKRK
jgi:uncharacterized membrane protein